MSCGPGDNSTFSEICSRVFGFFGAGVALTTRAGATAASTITGAGGAATSRVFFWRTGVLRFTASLTPAGRPRLFGAISGAFSVIIGAFSTFIEPFSELSGFVEAFSPDNSSDNGTTSIIYLYIFFQDASSPSAAPRRRSSCRRRGKCSPCTRDQPWRVFC